VSFVDRAQEVYRLNSLECGGLGPLWPLSLYAFLGGSLTEPGWVKVTDGQSGARPPHSKELSDHFIVLADPKRSATTNRIWL
jgi:hypothetical protein